MIATSTVLPWMEATVSEIPSTVIEPCETTNCASSAGNSSLRRQSELSGAARSNRLKRQQRSSAIHMALHHMPTQRRARRSRQLKVHHAVLAKPRKRSTRNSLSSKISREARRKRIRLNQQSRKANTVHRHTVTRIQPRSNRSRSRHRNPSCTAGRGESITLPVASIRPVNINRF